MHKFLVLKCVAFFVIFTIGIIKSTAQTNVQLFDDYNNLIQINRFDLPDGKVALSQTFKSVDTQITGAYYINGQQQFWDYLLLHFSQRLDYDELAKITDTVLLQKKFISHLTKDTVFNPIIREYTQKAIVKNQSKDSISMDALLNIAVKFLNVEKITDEDYYTARICTGLNEIKNTEKNRKPFPEAFCFGAVIENINNEKYNLYPYFVESIKNIYKLNLGIDKKDRLLRAQGAIFIQMFHYDKLKELLKDEYEKNKDILPFILSS